MMLMAPLAAALATVAQLAVAWTPLRHRQQHSRIMRRLGEISSDSSSGVFRHFVRVAHVPEWVDTSRLLGSAEWTRLEDGSLEARLPLRAACTCAARIRGVGLGGSRLAFEATPKLPRAAVRAARLEDARGRRQTSPGFTRKGVRLDEEGRWSLTPERLAMDLALRVGNLTVVDATCGAGGNSIAFARAGCRVRAIDNDRARLDLARHNSRVYGVEDKIDFMHGDATELITDLSADVLFVDPPWGTDWDRERTGLDSLPLLRELLGLADGRFTRVFAKVPPSFNPSSTPGARPEPVFGHESGDSHRVKFVLLQILDFKPFSKQHSSTSAP